MQGIPLSEFPPTFLQASTTSTFINTQSPDYVCDAVLWSPQYESNANLVLHKTTNSQIIKDKVHNVKDTLFDNDKTPNIKEKTNCNECNFQYKRKYKNF